MIFLTLRPWQGSGWILWSWFAWWVKWNILVGAAGKNWNSFGYISNICGCNSLVDDFESLVGRVCLRWDLRNEINPCRNGLMELSGNSSQVTRPGPVIEFCSTSLGRRYVMVEYQFVLHQYMSHKCKTKIIPHTAFRFSNVKSYNFIILFLYNGFYIVFISQNSTNNNQMWRLLQMLINFSCNY